jgi:predicted ATPase
LASVNFVSKLVALGLASAEAKGSYDLLSEAEQTMLRGPGVFEGSFTLEAKASDCATGAPVTTAATADALAGLVDKSLVVSLAGMGDNRYRLLESTRAFALEKLTAGGYGELGAPVVRVHDDRVRAVGP